MREKTALSQHYFTSFACSNFFRPMAHVFRNNDKLWTRKFLRSMKVAHSRKLLLVSRHFSWSWGGGDGVAYGLDVWSINNPVVPPPGQLWSRVFDAQLKYKFFQQALEWRRTNNQKVLETISVQTLRFTSSDLVVRQQKKLTVSISIKCTKW